MKNIYLKLGLLIAGFAFVVSCAEKDEFTGESTMRASNPSLSVSLSFANDQTLIEQDKTYSFTVTISEPQIVNVSVKLKQTSGSAQRGVNFDFPDAVVIPAGQTSASDVITIIKGDRANPPLDVTIEIGTGAEANVQLANSQTVKFTILNLREGDLVVGMSWASSSNVTDNGGNEIDPTDLADLRLLLTDVPYTTILDGADGGSFETYTLTEDSPDGEYYIVADFYAAMDVPSDLDIQVTFDQVGVINGLTFDFPKALNTIESCEAAHYILTKIVKTGDSYVVTPVGEPNALDLNNFVGTWAGTTSYGHPSQMVTSLNADGMLEVTGIGVGFMENDWGEVITDMQKLVMDVNMETGEFTIVETYYMSTTYLGDPQPVYNLLATGTLSGTCSPRIDMVYDFIQAGTSYTDWLGGFGWPPFEEHNTRN